MLRQRFILVLLSVAIVGCATKRQLTASIKPPATTRAISKADLSLDEIEPKPVLPTTQAATTESTPPPIDAVVTFAQARDELLQGRRYTAINLLEKAIKLDPNSYEIRYLLAQANAGPGMPYDPAIAAFQAAANVGPDHIAVHTELGRLLLAKGNVTAAIEQFRLATQTSEYQDDDSQAAIADFFLAKSLQQAGYERAALDSYVTLIGRLQNGELAPRGNPELAYLINQPEGLFVQIGELFQKRGQLENAIRLYKLAAEHKPDEFSFQAHVVRALNAAGKSAQATDLATQLVQQFHASPESIALLKETYRKKGGDAAVIKELERLRNEDPDDRTVLYALVDVLTDAHQTAKAQALLIDATKDAHYETEMVRRLFKLDLADNDVDSASRLIIVTLAARPDATRELLPMWADLLRPWRKNHLTLAKLSALDVPPAAQASKLFWVSQLARLWGRDIAARSALEQAVKQVPPFAPAYRGLLGQYWQREDWDEKQKQQASKDLIDTAEKQGDTVLADEMRGLVFLTTKKPDDAAKQFAAAIDQGNPSSDLRLSYATALQASGQTNRATDILWKLIEDHPTYEDAYTKLFGIYLEAQQGDQARKVLSTWRSNDPSSTNAKILEATVLARTGQTEAAKRLLDDLFDAEPDNADVLNAMSDFYTSANRVDDFVTKLEAQRSTHPENRAALEQLILIYAGKKEIAQASRDLDAARQAAADDPDLLYFIASLYTRIGEKDMCEQVLSQIIQIDPHHPAACNDLGYAWADDGKNLAKAEQLIRVAVQAEPDNQSFLDSLGWVLYKRAKFADARQSLEAAIGTSSLPDAVVLDHLGDTLYRLGEHDQATKTWKRSEQRIGDSVAAGEDRDELRTLRLQLQAKLKAVASGAPVSVAPTAEESNKQVKK